MVIFYNIEIQRGNTVRNKNQYTKMLNMTSEDLIKFLKIPVIDSDRKYWLIRTKGGLYYDEFKLNEFVAFGYDFIKSIDDIVDLESDAEEKLKKKIEEKYNTKRPGMALSLIKKFMTEIKKGDIVFIPSENSEKLTFGIVTGGMYLNNNLNNIFLNDLEDEINKNKCPYIKRIPVKWVKTVEKRKLDDTFFRILQDHHAIVDATRYDSIIDRTLESLYIKNGKTHLKIDVTTIKPIKGHTMSSFQNFIFNNEYWGDKDAYTKINVQSPGFVEVISENWDSILMLAIVLICISGGNVKFKDFELNTNGLFKFLLDLKKQCDDNKIETKKINHKHEMEYIDKVNQMIETSKTFLDEIKPYVDKKDLDDVTITDDSKEDIKK